uniref:Uncharacterized protein n=1 Tax=Cacopsylla melanoneura TaxID=428564 RepID=A0A8D8TU19_9HEMI
MKDPRPEGNIVSHKTNFTQQQKKKIKTTFITHHTLKLLSSLRFDFRYYKLTILANIPCNPCVRCTRTREIGEFCATAATNRGTQLLNLKLSLLTNNIRPEM